MTEACDLIVVGAGIVGLAHAHAAAQRGLRVTVVERPWQIDDTGLRIAWRGQWLPLTPLEFRMLRHMLSQPGRVFSRAQLLESAHADQRDVSDRAIDTHVKNLRRKLQAVRAADDCIASVYGVGYRFDAPPD